MSKLFHKYEVTDLSGTLKSFCIASDNDEGHLCIANFLLSTYSALSDSLSFADPDNVIHEIELTRELLDFILSSTAYDVIQHLLSIIPRSRPPEASTNCDNVAIGEADGDTPITKDEYLEALQSIEKAITLLNERAFKSQILTDDVHYGLLSVEMQLEEIIDSSIPAPMHEEYCLCVSCNSPFSHERSFYANEINDGLCRYCFDRRAELGNFEEYSCFVCGESTNAAGVCNACAWSDA